MQEKKRFEPNAAHLTGYLIDEGIKARAHYQVWWALRNRSLPKYLDTMNNYAYVDFFHAANSGHYTLFMLSLAKIFDRDSRVAGIKQLKRALRDEGRMDIANEIEQILKPHALHVLSVVSIRNQSVVHNEFELPIQKIYEVNGITPNQLRDLIDAACRSINLAASALGLTNRIFDSDRTERATLNLLEVLSKGAKTS